MNNVAILGAMTNIGRKIINTLSEYQYSANNIVALDNHEFEGHAISFGNKILEVGCLQHFDFNEADIVISTIESTEVSKFYCNKARDCGCIIIDMSLAFKYNNNVPLIVSDINLKKISNNSQIIAVPHSVTIQTAIAIEPIRKLFNINRIVMSTYQAASNNGKKAMDELFNSTKKVFENSFVKPVEFKKSISFNVIPQVGTFINEDEYTNEYEIHNDINDIYDNKIASSVTCVNVPVFNCNAISLNVECNNKIDLELLEEEYEISNNIMIIDNPQNYSYITPKECNLDKNIFISRIRIDKSIKNGINMWIVADNLTISAINIVKILDFLKHNR